MCSADLTKLSVHSRQAHYDGHFTDQPEGSDAISGGAVQTLGSKRLKPSSSPYKKRSLSSWPKLPAPEKRNIFWHSSRTSEPPANFSPGLIPVLKKALTKSHERGVTERAWLAFEHAVHIKSEGWDRTWGCGYRNYLMACAALMDQQWQPMYFPLLDAPTPPGILNLQELLEEAWRHGFDEEGAQQLQHKLVGTDKWIGTADLYVAFTYRGIPAQLVDFNDLRGGVEPLMQWIYNYFSGGDPRANSATVGEALRGARAVNVTDKLPIILQYQGHSQTIVGCERVKNGAIKLLTFDPSGHIPSSIRQAGLHYHNPGRPNGATSTASKVLHRMMHPVETVKSKKRKSTEAPHSNDTLFKRKRPSDPESRGGGEVILIESDSDEDVKPSAKAKQVVRPDELDSNVVLAVFRIDAKKLKKRDKYQILYFPLEDPLSEQEKLRRRVVTSEKVA
ncbi:DUF1671-domain-containing protein [Pilatotrama ljubarskyi]|nr:DUF1671-domain-containing protein [Pilatotrama ljubarskyi]